MKTIRYTLMALLLMACTAIQANQNDSYSKWGPKNPNGWGVIARAGYVLGGTSPMPLPQEIRSINTFKPNGGFTVGVDTYKMFSKRWGLMLGVHFFLEGMYTGADVKNYRMGITMGEDNLEGNFTGTDVTEVSLAGYTIPLMATFRISPRWNVNVGPYVSIHARSRFFGEVFNGYLREGDPTGPKIEISEENPASYDFSEHTRRALYGVQFSFDWKATRHMNVFAGLDWGMSSLFPKDFKTIEFPMYPLYAKFGLAYRL